MGLEFVSAAPCVVDPRLGADPTDDETTPPGSDRAGIEQIKGLTLNRIAPECRFYPVLN